MITELTPEQETQLEIYAKKWRNIGLSTEPANRPEAEKGIRSVYELAGHKQPKEIRWVDSPYQLNNLSQYDNMVLSFGYMFEARKSMRNQMSRRLQKRIHLKFRQAIDFRHIGYIESTLHPEIDAELEKQPPGLIPLRRLDDSAVYLFHGQDDIMSLCVLDFYSQCFPATYTNSFRPYLPLIHIATHAGWWSAGEEICIITERHNILHLDDQDRLHCEDGLAIGYPDGWGVYAWHGVRVPEWVIMQPDKITPDGIMNEDNAEVARVMIERYGLDNFIRDGGFSKVQSDDYGELYRVEFMNNDEPIVAVKVKDASTDREYFLYVPPHITSAHEGVAWTFGYDNVSDYRPDKET